MRRARFLVLLVALGAAAGLYTAAALARTTDPRPVPSRLIFDGRHLAVEIFWYPRSIICACEIVDLSETSCVCAEGI